MKEHTIKKALITAALAGVLIGLTLFIFETFQSVIGHGIAIASFGATALIVVFNPRSPGASPKAIFLGYVMAGLVALLFTALLPFAHYLEAAIIIAILTGLQVYFNMVHPPAVAYSLSYIYGGYGVMEFFLTMPAILGFFVAFGVLAFVLQIIASLINLDSKESKKRPTSFSGKLEFYIDAIIPYALVLLFVSIVVELVNPEFFEMYGMFLTGMDWGILVLFAGDLYFKYKLVSTTTEFFKKYWLDIFATIPFFVILRFFEGAVLLFRLEKMALQGGSKVTSLSKLLKPIARFPRFAKLIERIEDLD